MSAEFRRLEADETFQFLFSDDGPIGQEIAALTRQLLSGSLIDPLHYAQAANRRLGLLRVVEAVTELAKQEKADRERQAIQQARTGARPADSPFTKTF